MCTRQFPFIRISNNTKENYYYGARTLNVAWMNSILVPVSLMSVLAACLSKANPHNVCVQTLDNLQ